MSPSRLRAIFGAMIAFLYYVSSASALPTFAATYAGSYTITNLPTPLGVPTNFGGLTIKYDSPNTLLLGGHANEPNGAIYSIGVTRNAGGHITGFSSAATAFASAANVDAGLAYGPNNVLFATTYNDNRLLQYKPGSSVPDKTISVASFGVTYAPGGAAFVPAGYTGAGSLWISSYSNGAPEVYKADLVPDGFGTYDLAGSVTQIAMIPRDRENFAWVPGNSPVFGNSSQYLLMNVGYEVKAFPLNASGYPVFASSQTFLSGFNYLPIGMTIDPVTNDLLLSQFGSAGSVYVVSGFAPVPEPSSLLCGLVAMSLLGWFRRTRCARKLQSTAEC